MKGTVPPSSSRLDDGNQRVHGDMSEVVICSRASGDRALVSSILSYRSGRASGKRVCAAPAELYIDALVVLCTPQKARCFGECCWTVLFLRTILFVQISLLQRSCLLPGLHPPAQNHHCGNLMGETISAARRRIGTRGVASLMRRCWRDGGRF